MEEKNKKAAFSATKYAWIIGALILIIAAWFGLKTMLSSLGEYKITLVDAPKEIEEGNIATFTWRIDGPPTTIHHTVVYYGLESNPGELDTKVKPADTKYTDFVKDFASGDYGIPLQFIGNGRIDKQGTYYFRVYATIKDKNYWTDEYSLVVKPLGYKVSMISAPKEASAGSTISFTWRVSGPSTTINQTSVHLGKISVPGTLGPEVKPKDTKYSEMIDQFADGEYKIPLQFVGNIKLSSPGTYYYRAHALIEGQNYWTDESSLEVK